MSPLSLPVLTGTAVIGSPAAYAALGSGTLSPDVAITRMVLCALGVWAVCSVVAALVTKAVATNAALETQRPADVGSEEPAPVDVMTGSPAGRVTAMDSPAA